MKSEIRAFVLIFTITAFSDGGGLLLLWYFNPKPTWWIALPVFSLNLPAIPMAYIFSKILENEEPLTSAVVAILYISEILFSSAAWGLLAFLVVRRRAKAMRGFPINSDFGKKQC